MERDWFLRALIYVGFATVFGSAAVVYLARSEESSVAREFELREGQAVLPDAPEEAAYVSLDLLRKIPSPEQARLLAARARAGDLTAVRHLRTLCMEGRPDGPRQRAAFDTLCEALSEIKAKEPR